MGCGGSRDVTGSPSTRRQKPLPCNPLDRCELEAAPMPVSMFELPLPAAASSPHDAVADDAVSSIPTQPFVCHATNTSPPVSPRNTSQSAAPGVVSARRARSCVVFANYVDVGSQTSQHHHANHSNSVPSLPPCPSPLSPTSSSQRERSVGSNPFAVAPITNPSTPYKEQIAKPRSPLRKLLMRSIEADAMMGGSSSSLLCDSTGVQ